MLTRILGHLMLMQAAEGGSGGAGGDGGDAAAAATAAAAAGKSDPPAGGGDGGAKDAPAGQAPPASGQASGDKASPSAYRPEGLPEHLAGATDQETIDKLFKSVDGFRRSIADKGEIPADPTGYTFEPTESVKPYADNLGEDEFFKGVKAAAHKHGIPTKQFNGFINDVMETMINGEMVAAPYSPDREREKLLPDVKDAKERSTQADALVRENIARVDAWRGQGMPEDVATWFTSHMDRAVANQAVMWIAQQRQETPPATGGAPAGGVTQATLDSRVADPRGNIDSSKYDPAFAAETQRLFQAFHGATPRT